MTQRISYFPGCTLTNTARNFDLSAREALKALGVELVELPRWNCCGTVYSLASDNLINHVAPIRLLVRAQDLGHNRLTTLCSMCYNTLKRSNLLVQRNPEKLEKIDKFMDEEKDYRGEVDVVHVLQILQNDVGFAKVKEGVKKPLKGLKVAPYYGCLLTRPKEIAIDDVEMPSVMGELLAALGAEDVYDPYLTECCGSYHTVQDKDVVVDKARRILASARGRGADAVMTSCPLCFFNLDERQRGIAEKYGEADRMPILYFTQALALALGLGQEVCGFDMHFADPRPLLKSKGLI